MSNGTVVVTSFFGDDALPIGDVDRDGVADILSTRLLAHTPSVDIMSGRTGRVLWSRNDSSTYAAIYVAAPKGTPMVLVLSDSGTGADAFVAGAGDDVFTITALRADHGTQLWSTSITGAIEYDLAGFRTVGVGDFDGVMARNATTPYLLLDRMSEGGAFVTGGSSIAPEVIDAATGNVVTAGQPVASDAYAFASPVNDLNGDGTDDYVVATSGEAAVIGASSGANGTPLWTITPASPSGSAFVNFVGDSPDFSGDHKPDLLAGWSDGSTDKVVGLAGTSGNVVWSHSGDYATPIGDIDHDGRSDSRVLTWDQKFNYAAVNATGHTLWSRAVSSPRTKAIGQSYPVGDLNRDGVVDTYLRFVLPATESGDSTGPAVAAYVIDGRTGRLRVTHDLGVPSGDSLTGHAMTFVQTVGVPDVGMQITAFDGQSGRTLWHSSLPSRATMPGIDVSVLPLGHNRHGIVELVGGHGSESVVLFDGKRGTRQWFVTYATQSGGAIFFG